MTYPIARDCETLIALFVYLDREVRRDVESSVIIIVARFEIGDDRRRMG